jgi:PAS domain S-box-containing protein
MQDEAKTKDQLIIELHELRERVAELEKVPTKRRRVEKVLRESDDKYHRLAESIPGMVFQYVLHEDGSFALLYVNERIMQYAGILPEAAMAEPSLLFTPVHHDDREMIQQAISISARTLNDFSVEHRLIDINGQLRWFRVESTPQRLSNGDILWNGVSIDITEQKQMEDALEKSKAYLTATIESIPFEFWVMGPDGCYAMQNSISRGRYGDAIGKRAEDVCPNESMLSVWQDNNRRAFAGEVVKGEVRFLFENEERYIYNVVAPIHDRDRICGILGINVDITERKQTEESLLLSEDRYRRLFEDAVLGIYRSTAEGKIIDVNPAYARMYGFDSPEEAKRLVNDVAIDLYVDPSRRNDIVRMISDAKEPIHLENLYKRRDGSIFPGNLHAWAVRDREGKVLYLEGFVEDITERKRAEAEKAMLETQLLQAQKLEAIGTLAGGIAHDFNNILQPIISYTEMALNELSPSNPVRDGLEQVLNASLRAKELVRQILAVSRASQGQQKMPIDISSIIKEVLKFLRSSLPTSIEIRQNIQMGVALADSTQIHQVLMNLCTNAAHAMNDKGILEVHLSPVDLSESDLADQAIFDLKPRSYLRLTVSDTGCGMDAKTMERIFDPYFTTKEVGKGSGLGLAVVHGIIKRYDGAITVQSEPGKGSTFSIYIPKVDVKPEATIQVADLLPRGPERILLVDDEPTVMETGTRLLERLGYKVTSQTDSVKALEIFRSSPDEFDLVITDYTMPKLTGLDFAREVFRIRPDMPIMLCTGFSEKITPDSVKELGVGLLMKPYGMRQISEAIRKILDARKGG